MYVEYERRYIVPDLSLVDGFDRSQGYELIVQGYLAAKNGSTIRIRRRLGMQGFPGYLLYESEPVLEFKGPRVNGARVEHRWETTDELAGPLLRLAMGLIQKRRYSFTSSGGPCEVDEFLNENQGLIVAEFESDRPLVDFDPPLWCGIDVTDERDFDNEMLSINPISWWPDERRQVFGLGDPS